jgi:histidine triad (HIT) family protein
LTFETLVYRLFRDTGIAHWPHFDLHVVQRENGDKLSFAKGMLLRHDPDREKTGRTLREALEKIDATE